MMPSSKVRSAGLSTLEISSAWNLPPIIAIGTPLTGTIHQITLLSSNEGSYVLRAYRYAPKDRSRITTEHALVSYVQAHGLPAIAPFSLPSGETILEHESRFYALYPFAQGQQIARSQVTSPQIVAAMGRCLGELHQILSSYPSQQVRRQSFVVDKLATLSKIDRLLGAISEKSDFNAFDQDIRTQLMQRRTWLTAAHALDLEVLSLLEQQVLHGDYQETNLFFTDGRVSAIIDWDQAYVAPRYWEIIRTLHYVFAMDRPRCQIFLNAYREVFPLSWKDLESTAQAYGWVQANNLWAYTSYYLDHNDRVRPLLQTNFMPFEEMWAGLAE